MESIADIYMDNYLMPRKLAGDAFHLAYASFYRADFLLTWNCDHLANANKKQPFAPTLRWTSIARLWGVAHPRVR